VIQARIRSKTQILDQSDAPGALALVMLAARICPVSLLVPLQDYRDDFSRCACGESKAEAAVVETTQGQPR
jgi:hypothetical protein